MKTVLTIFKNIGTNGNSQFYHVAFYVKISFYFNENISIFETENGKT